MSEHAAHVNGPCSLRMQSILYHPEPRQIYRAIESAAHAVEQASRQQILHTAEIALGDCSSAPVLTSERIAELEHEFYNQGIGRIEYQFFNANLGSAAGHNRLLISAGTDLVMIHNPEVIFGPDLISEMVRPLKRPGVGQVEARQVPLEHPKHYDPTTGQTSWASTACSLIPRSVLALLNGFDAETFFLYCDDVDFSWRIRLAGYHVVFQPSASVFHDKRLSKEGGWIAGPAEQYYSAEAALLLAHKYSRPELVSDILRDYDRNGSTLQKRAAAEYRHRSETGRLPVPIDPDHRVAEFVNGAYTTHRW